MGRNTISLMKSLKRIIGVDGISMMAREYENQELPKDYKTL